MTHSHRGLTNTGSIARRRVNAAPLASLGVPLIGLYLMAGYGLLYGVLPVLAIALVVIGAGEAWHRRAPIVAAGLILLLLVTAGSLAARLVPWSDDGAGSGLFLGLLLGCAGLTGCAAAWRWLRRDGSGWAGLLLWIGGWVMLPGAALCTAAYTSPADGDEDWTTLGYFVGGSFLSIVGALLMLIGAVAMVARHRSAGVRSSAGCPAGGR